MQDVKFRAGQHGPASHARLNLRQPVLASMMHRNVAAHLLEAGAPEHLYAAGNGILRIPLAALPPGVGPLVDVTARNAEPRITLEPVQNRFVIIVPLERDICIQNPNAIEIQRFGRRIRCVDGLVLGTEAAFGYHFRKK